MPDIDDLAGSADLSAAWAKSSMSPAAMQLTQVQGFFKEVINGLPVNGGGVKYRTFLKIEIFQKKMKF